MRRRACNTNIANDGKNVAEQIVQLSSTGEETYELAPEPKPTQEVERLQAQLAVMTDILKKKDKEIDFLRALADDKIGPVKLPNISRVSESNKRGLQILASRYTKTIRSKLAAEANARINFYIIAKRRTTGVESLVPVKLIIDMNSKTTEVILDEGRPLMVGLQGN